MVSSGLEAQRSAADRRVARGVVVLTLAVSLWSMILPFPYVAAACAVAAVPVVALAVLRAGRGRFALEARHGDPRPSFPVALVLPAVALWSRSLDLTILDREAPFVWAAAVALPLSVLTSASDPALRRRWLAVPVLAIVWGVWAWGAIRFADTLLDGSEGEVYEARVLDKRSVGGRSPAQKLRLSAWGPGGVEREVNVPQPVFAQVRVGDVVCPTVRPGALGLRWLRIERCER
jgi:hypothetical protein